MTKLTLSELEIGDVVKLLQSNGEPYAEPFNELTVIQKNEKQITFFRPYVSLSQTVYAGGSVIKFIGTEQFAVPLGLSRSYLLIGKASRI